MNLTYSYDTEPSELYERAGVPSASLISLSLSFSSGGIPVTHLAHAYRGSQFVVAERNYFFRT